MLGHSYALVADGIESCADVFSSLVVWKALRVAAKPADAEHPYGHGKAESLAGVIVAGALLVAAVGDCGAKREGNRHAASCPRAVYPARARGRGRDQGTTLPLRSPGGRCLGQHGAARRRGIIDRMLFTSAAAFVGIVIALLGGPRLRGG